MFPTTNTGHSNRESHEMTTPLSVTISADTGASAHDAITAVGLLAFSGIRADTTLEFRLKPASESAPTGTDWLPISAEFFYAGDNNTLSTDVYSLHYLAGTYTWDYTDTNGQQDTWEFRQVDASGKVTDTTAPLTLTLDGQGAWFYGDTLLDSTLENGNSSVLRFFSTEKFSTLDKNAFQLNAPELATITKVAAAQANTDAAGQPVWAYDVTIQAAASGSGELKLSLLPDAGMDAAGNAAYFSDDGFNNTVWIGAGAGHLATSLVYDSGVAGDRITHTSTLKLYGIDPSAQLEFRLTKGSESAAAGTAWLAVPTEGQYPQGNATTTDLLSLYQTLGVNAWDTTTPQLADVWEFRQVDSAGKLTAVAEATAITYDLNSPEIHSVALVNNSIQNDATAVMRLFSDERLQGVTPDNIWVSDALVSVTAVSETRVTDAQGERWAYDVTLNAAASGEGEVMLGLYNVTDLAGNWAYLNQTFWVGAVPQNLTAALVYDSGTEGDAITSDAWLNVFGLKSTQPLEVRLQAGSATASAGTEWVAIPDELLCGEGWSVQFDTASLYALWSASPAEGKDAWEFRQVDAQGVASTAAIAFTYEEVDMAYAYFTYPEYVSDAGSYGSYYDYSAVTDVSEFYDTWAVIA